MEHILSCDWGTSTFRLRALDVTTKEIRDEVRSDYGINKVHQDWLKNKEGQGDRVPFYKNYMVKAVKELQGVVQSGTPIIISGMVSSSIGMLEMPYQPLPFVLSTGIPIWQFFEGDSQLQHPLYIVSGFSTNTDVMRGEETMLLGIDGLTEDEICILPGTHSKHAYIKSGVLTDFKTYITGELFNVMSQFSILSNSMEKGEDTNAFDAGLDEAASGNLLNQFFRVRTRQLLNKVSATSNYQFLSGLLIGTELKDLRNTSTKIRLISEGSMTQLYSHALKRLSLNVTVTSATEALVNGHLKILKGIQKN